MLALSLLVYACHHHVNETRSDEFSYILKKSDIPAYEEDIDHAGLISQMQAWTEDWELRDRAMQIYRNHCFNCHGSEGVAGSLPEARPFWNEALQNGNDPFSMYQTITRGHGLMPPQLHLTPQQKYEVITFIRETLIKPNNSGDYFQVDNAYLAGLPTGNSLGPERKPYHPWRDMDYGNWMMRCFELAEDPDEPKVISRGRAPLPNEDYSEVNFAYKGIAIRLDSGPGGIAKGNTFALFDHDLLRFVGAWTGEGFIDWEDILLDDQHNVYPRTVGTTLMANPITPGWADPVTGTFEDPRFLGSDGRPFGPLPREWAHYKGLYRHQEREVIKYSVGNATVLESYDVVEQGRNTVIVRHLSVRGADLPMRLRVLPDSFAVKVQGNGARIVQEDGFHVLQMDPGGSKDLKLLMTEDQVAFVQSPDPPINLEDFTQGSQALYPEEIKSSIQTGDLESPFAVDVFDLPLSNPWKSRVRLTGIDFLGEDAAVVCSIDGEVWRVEGIASNSEVSWQRIATGLFQPLGIKVIDGAIYVGCRDQIAILRDLNGDGETDYYESFNSDHQVTEHFHEFAMGLQADSEGNLYYAKSGRHARTSLVPQHGTLIKVSADGSTTEILANGFRAANGVCLNPDGSFYVTDQQGYWNPMNRINRVEPGGFYGNMWGYGASVDSSDEAMEQPLCWVDMEYDRSPAELLWAETDQWGPLNGQLLNLSYGYGKIYLVLQQESRERYQGGIVELPLPSFPTGIMRGRFHPEDGQLYVCGMSAWATNQMLQVGGLYRIRYTGKPLHLPVDLKAYTDRIRLTFSEPLDHSFVKNASQYQVRTWDLKRSRQYGSDRYNEKRLEISAVEIRNEGKTIDLMIDNLQPTWGMEIKYILRSARGQRIEGGIQNSVFYLDAPNDIPEL